MSKEKGKQELIEFYNGRQEKDIAFLSDVIDVIDKAHEERTTLEYGVKKDIRDVLQFYLSPQVVKRRTQLIGWGLEVKDSTLISYEGSQYYAAIAIVEDLFNLRQLSKVLLGLKTYIENGREVKPAKSIYGT